MVRAPADFAVVVQPPFVVTGDELPVASRALVDGIHVDKHAAAGKSLLLGGLGGKAKAPKMFGNLPRNGAERSEALLV